jgi:RNA polymerase sigma-70 factor (ECF subfamily)
MTKEAQDALEQKVQRCRDLGDAAGTATLVIRGYGAEIYGFLVTRHRDEEDAAEVFSLFSERLWRDLAAFRGDCSFRTWAYTLARNTSLNYVRDERRKQKRQRPLPEDSDASAIVEQVRSQTVSYMRTAPRARFSALRESLPLEDQTLLILHVDRGLKWNELVRVLNDGSGALDDEHVKREAARLRKRFQGIKDRLRELRHEAKIVNNRKGGK